MASLLSARELPRLQIEIAAAGSEAVRGADILLGPPDIVAQCLDEAASLRWVQSTWAGVTPLVAHPRRDYVLTGVKGVFGQAMSEYVLGWLLALERRIIDRARQRCWDDRIEPGMANRRLGILGTGSIGCAVARGGAALGLSIRGLNSDGRAVDGFSACYAARDRLQFAAGLDYLVALLPDTAATRNLVDRDLLHCLSPGAIFINAGRAGSVVEDELLAALACGQLRAAVLDVTPVEPLPPDDRLWSVENLYLTSHTAAPSAPETLAGVFCDNYRRYLAGEPLQHQVNFERGY
jgi:phosphoglycerate dehydrogenase-like enzyme